MSDNGPRNFLSRFLLKQDMKDEQIPLAARTFESYSPALPHAQPASQEAQSEMELVRCSCQGDQDAFAVLVRNHQRRAFILAFRMLNDYEEASEAVQEAFLAAWQGLHTFRGEARFSTWLYRIVYHCCLRVLEQRRRDSRDLDAATAQAEHRAVLEAGQEVQSLVADRERQKTIQQAIQELPGKYRAVLILRHLQELTYEEIAQALSLPVGTIKTHLFRARNLLKERLQSLERDEHVPPASAQVTTSQPSTAADDSSSSLFVRLTPSFLRAGEKGKGGTV
ncbi:MAG TPA: sigma-70 family RNA polymerase sigma factor [Ktedonobacterales bacterium]|nr:sigma-70 family RNA polymerase sigma factor [Ktedonobacterales bacterium]